MYEIKPTGQYKKDLKLCNKRKCDISLIATALKILQETGTLPVDEYGTHKLSSIKPTTWDAHLEPDWLLLFQKFASDNPKFKGEIVLVRTGSHSDLFKK